MATTARRSRSARPFIIQGVKGDPINDVLANEREKVADDLSDTLDSLAGISGSNIKIYVYKIRKNGPWENVKILEPPVKSEEIIEFCREEYGPGDYAARVYTDGRITTTLHFAVAQPKNALMAANRGLLLGGDDNTLLKLLLERNQPQDNTTLITMMMKQSDDANNRFMTMMSTMLPLLVQKPATDSTESLMKAASFLKEMQGPQQTMKDNLEMFAVLRDLAGGNDQGGFMGMLEKMAPALVGITEQTMRNQAGQPPADQAAQPGQVAAPALPAPRMPPPPVAGADGAPAAAANDAPGPAAVHPVLEIVKGDIAYFMHRGHNHELAADAIADILEMNGVTEDQVRGLGMEIFAAGPSWPAALAAYGLNVTSQPGHSQWFMDFVQSLAALYEPDADGDEHDDDRTGQGGGGANAGHHAPAGGRRKPGAPDQKPGSEADQQLTA